MGAAWRIGSSTPSSPTRQDGCMGTSGPSSQPPVRWLESDYPKQHMGKAYDGIKHRPEQVEQQQPPTFGLQPAGPLTDRHHYQQNSKNYIRKTFFCQSTKYKSPAARKRCLVVWGGGVFLHARTLSKETKGMRKEQKTEPGEVERAKKCSDPLAPSSWDP
uniref:Uncharacterized protein n=1 Tax=Panagrellus redivivus TaxID=6233 RepID=A0A7E4V709_PANRE